MREVGKHAVKSVVKYCGSGVNELGGGGGRECRRGMRMKTDVQTDTDRKTGERIQTDTYTQKHSDIQTDKKTGKHT